ncbi:MAG: rRNA maturation RNase YbeY [Beijerinckiaceae bacterium]
MAAVAITCEAPGWSAIPKLESLVRRAVDAALAAEDVELRDDAEVSILLTDDDAIRDLNTQWRSKDKPTNVLSFPSVSPDRLHEARSLGDIAIACETVFAEANAEAKPVADHLTHLVVHGVLHLLGRDHENDEEAEEMEALERAILAGLGVPDPYDVAGAAQE